MGIYSYEEAFGAADKTTRAMRQAIADWFAAYYGCDDTQDRDACQRIAYTVVNKIVRTVFGEYQSTTQQQSYAPLLESLDGVARQALELSLVGGSCFLKPVPEKNGFSVGLIPRSNVLIFGRDASGAVNDLGTVERSTLGRYYYTLLERRTVDKKGYLTVENKLLRSLNGQNPGTPVPLTEHPAYRELPKSYRFARPVGSVGLVELRTPMLNCVDGSSDSVSVYAPAMGLIRSIDENEAQLRQEFIRGQSRVIASRDLLKTDPQGNLQLQDHLFVGLDEDPEQVGITVFSPQLRHQSYLERKQEYLRNVESVIGLKRGMLSDANAQDRTATEISASAGDYNLTVIDFQRTWQQAVQQMLSLCRCLGTLYRMDFAGDEPSVSIDWGNGVLYDEDRVWADYLNMVDKGLMKPEIALGWRFNMPVQTPEQLQAIRQRFMP